MRTSWGIASIVALATMWGCEVTPIEGSSEGTEGVPPIGSSSANSGETLDPSASAGATGEGASSGATSVGDGSGGDAESTTMGSGTPGGTGGPGFPVDCGGTTYACGDGVDNDGDGRVDLFDPECTGPCDDNEESFQTGIPGDNMDCKQDCFFDGNSGQGDDGCVWNLRCDPANPGELIGCEYTGGGQCNNQPPQQDEACLEFCEPYVPPGCDCFGCCTVQTDDGPIDIFLNSSPDCSLDNLDACLQCTSRIDDCGTPCVPLLCHICFGETEPPEGCDEVGCPDGSPPCETNEDCADEEYCLMGCCYPPPVG